MNSSKRGSAKVYIDNSAAHGDDAAPAVAADTPVPSTVSSPSPSKPSPKARRRLIQRLSNDISTEQLFSDELIDGKVADGEDDEEDDEDEATEELVASKDRGSEPNGDRRSSSSRSHQSAGSSKPRKSSHRRKSSHGSSSKNKNTPTLSSQSEIIVEQESAEEREPKMYRIESHSHLSSLEATHLDKQQQYGGSDTTSTTAKPNNRHALAPIGSKPTEIPPVRQTAVCSKCLSNKDMPPLHCAAYSGHAGCLALLLEDKAASNKETEGDTAAAVGEPSSPKRPYYLDKKRRTPLFYSCAANKLDCCALLLSKRMEWRDMADKQLDTPVHVCCFFGWHECLDKLLNAGADPHGRNAKGFKPSHIAKTRECLELLLSYGDDLQQGDKLGRTPLFVACARDRSICVEFLCSWNHQTRSWMLEQEDQRGDRPIHAAACNGSNASLEILLKYGADPFIQNAKGMTPKNLAQANNHPKCVELLEKAEQDLTSANAWFAPANAAGIDESAQSNNAGVDATGAAPLEDTGANGWIECWDNNSGQPFYYNNLSGKCQWEVPEGFQPHLLQLLQSKELSQQQQQQYEDDENADYVWVKKKRQTVCVVTGKESEWTAVQDPASKAIYYKNTRTGQSQWEEPDAVQQLQSASAALASQQATKIWDELESSRTALARALAIEKQRQLQAQLAALEAYKLEIQRRKEDIRKKEEQAKLQQLLPRSSFIRRKKQSMMIKIKGSGGSNSSSSSTPQQDEEDKMELICQREPSLDIFLSTYLRLHGVRDLQLSIEKRFFNCMFHYYVALVDPVNMSGLSKSQFRTVLREAAIIPSSFTSNNAGHGPPVPTLKLHVVDLIFAQAGRVEAVESSHSHAQGLATSSSFSGKNSHSASYVSLVHHRQAAAAASPATGSAAEGHLGVVGFVAAMQIVRERMVALAEEQGDADHTQQPFEIDDDEEWFLTTYVLPLTVRLGGKMLTQIRECKELDLEMEASPKLQSLLAQNRQAIQRLHRYYTAQEPNKQLRILMFRGLSQFAQDFGIVPQYFSLPVLNQLYEAVNWISGHAHTDIISFEKFQQLLTILAVNTLGRAILTASTPASGTPKAPNDRETVLAETLVAFFAHLESCPAVHRVAAGTQAAPSSISSGEEVSTGSSGGDGTAAPSGVLAPRASFFQLQAAQV